MRSQNQPATVTAFLLKAIATAQQSRPETRTSFFSRSKLVTYNKIIAGITVERQVNGSPIVFFGEIEEPQKKSLPELSKILKDYASADIMQIPKLRQQKLFAEMNWLVRKIIWFGAVWFPSIRIKCQSATFGLSSLGSLGIDMVCGPSVVTVVFAAGAVSERVVVRDEQIVIRPMLSIALCYDQRVLDDAQAAGLLNAVQHILESESEW